MNGPDAGRTAEEMREQVARFWWDRVCPTSYVGRWNEAKEHSGFFKQLVSETYEDADAILSGPLAPILQEAAHLRAENANLRDRVREAEGAGRDPYGSGSRPSDQAASHPAPAGFDPSRWELSEEARAFIREIDLATVRPGDPRLSQTLIGPAGPAVGLDGYGSQARPLAPSYDPPRCTATGNPCGTDTCIVGHECPDSRWGGRCAHRIAKRVAALGIEARQGRDEGSACESPTPQGGMPIPLPDSRSENTGGRGAP